jgi:hypothetical protein
LSFTKILFMDFVTCPEMAGVAGLSEKQGVNHIPSPSEYQWIREAANPDQDVNPLMVIAAGAPLPVRIAAGCPSPGPIMVIHGTRSDLDTFVNAVHSLPWRHCNRIPFFSPVTVVACSWPVPHAVPGNA